MSKVAVVYYSGTGNTEKMAEAVAAGTQGAGAEVATFTCDAFAGTDVTNYDAIAFGCPAMGADTFRKSKPQDDSIVFTMVWAAVATVPRELIMDANRIAAREELKF